MPRLFFVSERISSSPVTLTGDEVHHLRVMRLGPGDCIYITDGSGLRYRAEILEMTRARSTLKILTEEPLPPRSRPRIMLAQAIPRYPAIEIILQKATELGVDCIYPVQTERSFSPRNTSVSHHRWQRWERIVIEAAKQSGRIDLPCLAPLQPLEDFLHGENLSQRRNLWQGRDLAEGKELLEGKNLSQRKDLSHGKKSSQKFSQGEKFSQMIADSYFKFCLWEGGDPHQRLRDVFPRVQRPDSILILVGPEGSFSPDELEMIRESGYHLISCGYRIMRVETAALMAVAVCQYEWGDL